VKSPQTRPWGNHVASKLETATANITIAQNNTPVIVTVGFIVVVIGYYLTTCFGPHGPSSGEYNILISPLTSSENYRYHNGSAVLSMSLIV
jgi:hypothetical protein